jgi:ribosomal protein S18 acetylase RimI-like enzyme
MMAQTIKPLIRRASAVDAHLLAQLAARTFQETFAADNKPEDMTAYLAAAFSPEKQAAELADPRSIFFIAEANDAAAGYAQLHAGDAPACIEGTNTIELARIYVAQEFLGRGVGEALMRACMDEASRAGHRTIWLGVWEKNERAQAFYRKWGFQVVGQHVFQLGSDPQTDLLMARALHGNF